MGIVEDRFWAKVNKTAGCWLWTASCRSGYGQVVINRKHYVAHRVAYTWLVGPIPEGLVLDHLCRHRNCVNPAHLQPVTHRENIMRGIGPTPINAAKPACKWGHEFTPENTWVDPSNGWRQCRACFKRRGEEVRKRRLAHHGTTKRWRGDHGKDA